MDTRHLPSTCGVFGNGYECIAKHSKLWIRVSTVLINNQRVSTLQLVVCLSVCLSIYMYGRLVLEKAVFFFFALASKLHIGFDRPRSICSVLRP